LERSWSCFQESREECATTSEMIRQIGAALARQRGRQATAVVRAASRRMSSIGQNPRTQNPAGVFPKSGRLDVSGVRPYSVAAEHLVKKLQDELEYEKRQEAEKLQPPPFFHVESPEGAGEIILRRAYDKEDIAVLVSVDPESYAESEEEGAAPVFGFQVSISKDGDAPPLEFDCQTDGGKVVINNVGFATSNEDFTAYSPSFTELDPALETLFHDYLEERGINAEFVSSLYDLVEAKEQEEYVRWLAEVQKFIKK